MRLHVYAQLWHHCEAFLVGERRSLQALAHAIELALDHHQNQTTHGFFTADGEGFDVIVRQLPAGNDLWQQLALPYTEDYAREQRPDAIWPNLL